MIRLAVVETVAALLGLKVTLRKRLAEGPPAYGWKTWRDTGVRYLIVETAP